MRRVQSSITATHAKDEWNKSACTNGKTISVDCTLVTPMYGGGVSAGEADLSMPIRASGIRGQLRFWWRLLYGAGKKSNALFKDEVALWGGIAANGPCASLVTVRANGNGRGAPRVVCQSAIRLFPRYALAGGSASSGFLQNGYSFNLTLTFDSGITPLQKDQVYKTLRWWLSFGGVGARTRRGLGAIRAKGTSPQSLLARCLKPVTCKEVQVLGGWLSLRSARSTPLDAWAKAVGRLEAFRQGVGTGRDPSTRGKPDGRSRWPEPDTIRRLLSTPAKRWPHPPQHLVDGFPRAAFGLPLVFRFEDDRDPRPSTLQPRGAKDRMASPLILRPYFDGQGWRPAALLIPGWEERIGIDVELKSGGRVFPCRSWPVKGKAKTEASNTQPIADNPPSDDPLTTFMNFFPK